MNNENIIIFIRSLVSDYNYYSKEAEFYRTIMQEKNDSNLIGLYNEFYGRQKALEDVINNIYLPTGGCQFIDYEYTENYRGCEITYKKYA